MVVAFCVFPLTFPSYYAHIVMTSGLVQVTSHIKVKQEFRSYLHSLSASIEIEYFTVTGV